jgi:malate dehydrogenase
MTVWGADAVHAAAGTGTLRVNAGDVVTPLARDVASESGVQIVVAGTTSLPERKPPPAAPYRRGAPPSAALYRRGAPLPAAVRPGTRGSGSTGRVVVVGAGHVGMITALRLADADIFDEVVLVDVVDGLAEGIALDLTHTSALAGFGSRVRGTTTVEDAGPADYVVITAGRARQPGMSRSDLMNTNAAIVGDIARRVAATSPDAVIVVVTNPLDEMTQHAWRSSGLPSAQVLGMAGVLDTARFQALVAQAGTGRAEGVGAEGVRAKGVRADHVRAVALGSHGDEMVIPLSQATAGGSTLTTLLQRPALQAIVDRTRGSGGEVVSLLKSGSAFLAPGTSAARMVLAMARDSGEVMPAAVLADGSYGIREVYVGLPARLGRGGLREIVELPLTDDELASLREAADRIRERLAALAAMS